jgi:hypothetical protein
MKQIITILVIASAFSSISCKKCATCKSTATVSSPGIPAQTASSTFEACGSDLREVDGKTVTTTSGTMTSTTTTVCD